MWQATLALVLWRYLASQFSTPPPKYILLSGSVVAAHDYWGEARQCLCFREKNRATSPCEMDCMVSNGKVVTGPWACLVRETGVLEVWELLPGNIHSKPGVCSHFCQCSHFWQAHLLTLPTLVHTHLLTGKSSHIHSPCASSLSCLLPTLFSCWHTYAHRNHFILTHANLVRHSHSHQHSNISTVV